MQSQPLSPFNPPQIQPDKHQNWCGLTGASRSLALVQTACQSDQPLLVITTGSLMAQQLEAELQFFAQGKELPIFYLPDWETLPYDLFSPHQDIISDRLKTLHRLGSFSRGILLVPIGTLMHRLMPRQELLKRSLMLNISDTLALDQFRSELESAGYRAVNTVREHGEFALRGGIFDIFPMGVELPYRIELLGDEIDTIRTFDSETQLSVEKIKQISLLPAREVPIDPVSITNFRNRWHDLFPGNPSDCSLYRDISIGIFPAGIEYYLPMFYSSCDTLFDYLPDNTQVVKTAGFAEAAETFFEEVKLRYNQLGHDLHRPIVQPEELFIYPDQLFGLINQQPSCTLHGNEAELPEKHRCDFSSKKLPDIAIDDRSAQPLAKLEKFLGEPNQRILIEAESRGRREILLEQLKTIQINPVEVQGWQEFVDSDHEISISIAAPQNGFYLQQEKIGVITELDLYNRKVMQPRRREAGENQADLLIKSLTELTLGSAVVHIEHGVGRYQGLQTLEIDGEDAEFLVLKYAESAKLYVPVASLDLISRYEGVDPDTAPLNRLGSDQWQKARRKAAEKIRDTAAELLEIYARREAKTGFSVEVDEESYRQFCAEFPFEETPDQQLAIDAVLKDMTAEQCMDRLVCGDVGFGKTEVAMRAAFLAVNDGRQVAILVPTTLLAQQHYETFNDRFADYPIKIEVLSRFKSAKEQTAVMKELENGQVDILIGTHKIIGKELKYKNLGLVVIDEEHRFGVRQKEYLKSIRAEVDILTLTATPIPRTLNMAMAGIRDLSIIASPPAKRLSIKTFVTEMQKSVIEEAIMREVLRGGQVYYLHNEVKTIEKTAEQLREMLPNVRVGVGHGQLRERALEQVMSDFYHKQYDVLVCTTIIETGIDVPNANTIIMERADKLGLAQLHQIRGRVGRSHHQAYAYLITPPAKLMTPDATKRLEAIEATQELGAGFTLASHDMEIRGAGALLGDDQSGQIHSIGFSLYMEMLENAVEAMKQGKIPDIENTQADNTEVNLHIPALIPDDYLGDVQGRLVLYKRIANADSSAALEQLQVEMIDRFGLLPPPIKNLFAVSELKLRGHKLGIKKLEANAQKGRIEFKKEANIDPMLIINLIQQRPDEFTLAGSEKLTFHFEMEGAEQRIGQVGQVLELISGKP
ncbi:MAG: transcription-repair coupling factor [Pseudomonadales bacterium]|nr:transcription-repair coupling factor [Pseudomonadales bacterium]